MTDPGVPVEYDPVRWFDQHYREAADEVIEFLGADGLSLEGKQVADVGCGDGVIDLGLIHKGRCETLVGYDIRPVDVDGLRRAARAAGVKELPAGLSFVESTPTDIPAVDDAFDVVVTWSAFEHISNPPRMLSEIRRILRLNGVLFLQIWPFYLSEHGGHLWPHYDDSFPHLRRSGREIVCGVKGQRATDPTRVAEDEYNSLNRITLEQLQLALLAAGLRATKLKLLTNSVHIPPDLAQVPFADVGTGGVKLLAVPQS